MTARPSDLACQLTARARSVLDRGAHAGAATRGRRPRAHRSSSCARRLSGAPAARSRLRSCHVAPVTMCSVHVRSPGGFPTNSAPRGGIGLDSRMRPPRSACGSARRHRWPWMAALGPTGPPHPARASRSPSISPAPFACFVRIPRLHCFPRGGAK